MLLVAVCAAAALAGHAATAVPTDAEVDCYGQLYKAGVIRAIRFVDEPDPREAMREEIYLERELARRAEAEGTTSDPLLQADIRYYQTQEILNELLTRRLPDDAVTSADIEQYYRTHINEFRTSETVKFRHIFFFVPAGDTAVERQKLDQARKVREKLARGADFAELAADSSELPAAKTNKGLVGPELTGKLNPAVQGGLAKLAPGEISEPVRTAYGWEILQLVERVPPRTRSLDDVAAAIRDALRRLKARELQEKLGAEVAKRYPATINERLLATSGTLPRDEWVFAVAGTTFTVERVLADIYATWSYTSISDDRERIRAALPRLVLTQQLLAAAADEGLLNDPALQTKLRLIRDRLAGERYYNNLAPKEKPTEKELRDHYAQNPDVFRTPPEAKGILFRWRFDGTGTTSGTSQEFVRESLRRNVEKIRTQAAKGEIDLDALRKLADEVKQLDWFREGPNGYRFDKAFFSAKEKSFTEIFEQRDAYAFGWVEGRKEPRPIPFEQCRDLVERRLINLRSAELRKKAVEEILAGYARQRQ
jgi:parvulin-like peptidyl-prolyl isomerase